MRQCQRTASNLGPKPKEVNSLDALAQTKDSRGLATSHKPETWSPSFRFPISSFQSGLEDFEHGKLSTGFRPRAKEEVCLWLVACGLWLVACGLWLVACGLWLYLFVHPGGIRLIQEVRSLYNQVLLLDSLGGRRAFQFQTANRQLKVMEESR